MKEALLVMDMRLMSAIEVRVPLPNLAARLLLVLIDKYSSLCVPGPGNLTFASTIAL
jgi:hypothetical protein